MISLIFIVRRSKRPSDNFNNHLEMTCKLCFGQVGIIATVLTRNSRAFQSNHSTPAPKDDCKAGAFLAIGFSGDHAGLPQQLLMLGLIFGFIGDAALLSQEETISFWDRRIPHRPCSLRNCLVTKFHRSDVHPTPQSSLYSTCTYFYALYHPLYRRFYEKSGCSVYSGNHGHGDHISRSNKLTGDTRYVIGAAMFALSDVSVAMDRFTTIPRWHRWLGIPLYFVSQYILASTLVVASLT